MKTIIKAVSLFLLSILVLSCNSTSKNKEIDTTLDDALLWRISGNGLSKDSFLFGTRHIVSSSFLDSIPEVLSMIQNSDCLITEVDIKSKPPIKSLGIVFKKVVKDASKHFLPEDINYTKLYKTAEEYYSVDDLLHKYDLGKLHDMRLSPITLQYWLMLLSLNEDKSLQLEPYFVEKATEAGKHLLYLETMDYQLKRLFTYIGNSLPFNESLSIEEQAKELYNYAKSSSSGTPIPLLDSDEEKYMSQKLTEMECDPETYKMLVSKRNKKWIPKIVKQIHEEQSFIAVGVLHLVGEDSLIYLLREKGYEVSPVK